MHRIHIALDRLAKLFYRATHETPSDGRETAKMGWYVGFVAILLSTLVWLLAQEAVKWSHDDVAVRLNPQSWHLWPEEFNPACDSNPESCPAQSTFALLWQSATFRSSTGTQSAKPFWLGYHLDPEQLREAQTLEAHYLVLGWIRGSYQIWINGEKISTGTRTDHHPIVVPFPQSWLFHSSGLSIAVRIEPTTGVSTPDIFAKPVAEKLTTARGASGYLSGVEFYKLSRPFSLLFLNLTISLLFFLLWFTDRDNREAYYLALYTLITAALQLRLTDIFIGQFPAAVEQSLDLILRSYEGLCGLLLGFALARLRRAFFLFATTLLLAPWLVIALSPSMLMVRKLALSLEGHFLPACYIIGGLLCLMQSVSLRQMPQSSHRRGQLLRFTVGFAVIAAFYFIEQAYPNSWLRSFFWRLGHSGVVMTMGLMALREYREQRKLIKRIPVSKYHRHIPLPDSITGTLLTLDLKNSENLSRQSAQNGDAGELTRLCLSHLWLSASHQGGTVLSSDGDQLKVFFDQHDHANPLLAALRAVDEMAKQLKELEAQGLPHPLCFRAGIALGSISPRWQVLGDERTPLWGEAGHTNTFVDSARLMELERRLSTQDVTHVLLSSEVSIPSAELEGHWIQENMELIGKHNRSYRVSVYQPQTQTGSSDVKAS